MITLNGLFPHFSIVHSILPSCTFSEMRVALQSACYPILQTDYRFVAQVLFSVVTAVIVMSSSQGHSHWCKGGIKGH